MHNDEGELIVNRTTIKIVSILTVFVFTFSVLPITQISAYAARLIFIH